MEQWNNAGLFSIHVFFNFLSTGGNQKNDNEHVDIGCDYDNDSDEDIDNIDAKQFIKYCTTGNLSEAIELYNKYKDELDNVNFILCSAFYKCCGAGKIDVVKWICSIHDIRFCSSKAVQIVCINGNLELLKFFHSIGFDIHYQHELPLRLACEYDHIEVAQWLHKMNAMLNYKCLENACVNGNLNIVNWIINVCVTTDNFIYKNLVRVESQVYFRKHALMVTLMLLLYYIIHGMILLMIRLMIAIYLMLFAR